MLQQVLMPIEDLSVDAFASARLRQPVFASVLSCSSVRSAPGRAQKTFWKCRKEGRWHLLQWKSVLAVIVCSFHDVCCSYTFPENDSLQAVTVGGYGTRKGGRTFLKSTSGSQDQAPVIMRFGLMV